jgi:hypothetical protein
MQAATRSWVLACLALLGSSLLLCCGTDEATHGAASAGDAGQASLGLGAEAAAFGGAPSNVGATGGSTTNLGGTKTTAGSGNSHDGGAAGSGADQPATAGQGGAPILPPEGEQLELCARLSGLVPHATAVERAYALSLYRDCDVTWLFPLVEQDLIDFKNGLVVWNLQLWGCQGAPVNTFALVSGTPALTAGDATALIDHYMAVTKAELHLSTPEFDEMRAALERLAKPLITDATTEFSNPQCATGAGGGGGVGGAQ